MPFPELPSGAEQESQGFLLKPQGKEGVFVIVLDIRGDSISLPLSNALSTLVRCGYRVLASTSIIRGCQIHEVVVTTERYG